MVCEICNRKLDVKAKLEEFSLFKCRVCKHIVTNLETGKKYYKETYSNQYVDKKHKNWMNNPNYVFFEKVNIFIANQKRGKILDSGCGTGLLLKYLNKNNSNYDLTGVDIIKNKKHKNIKFLKKEFYKFKPSKKFSYVISTMVIEHVPKVNLYLKHLRNITKKDAFFIVMTINTNSFLYMIANCLYKIGIKIPFIRLFDPHHLNHFSDKSLEKFLEKNNFSLVKRLKLPVNMKQIDFPYNNIITKYILYFGLLILLNIENSFNKSWIQTIIFKKK